MHQCTGGTSGHSQNHTDNRSQQNVTEDKVRGFQSSASEGLSHLTHSCPCKAASLWAGKQQRCSGIVAAKKRIDRQSAEREISDGEVLLGFFGTVTYKTPKEWLRTTIPTYSVSFPLHLRSPAAEESGTDMHMRNSSARGTVAVKTYGLNTLRKKMATAGLTKDPVANF
ncbi:hypothetical protein Anapl_04707 [Anas platyrhynchos]|uniref:Uncharacterized protein n=1 Tax=Anas platyrhynchos TaxID=8839 RepID=R0K3N0_ANAPL|nr:hypothetical protein Anapl_04707 [Anas platyrhynchos]